MADKPERKLSLTFFDQVQSRSQDFLDNLGLIPVGTLTIFSGRGGEGKTTVALDYVARISKGTLEGDLWGKPRDVLIVTHEDDPETQLAPRLKAAGAAMGRVAYLKVTTTDADMSYDSVPSIVGDLALFQEAIDHTDPALIVFDPLPSSIEGDPNKLQDVRRSLQPLIGLLQKNRLTCIGITHVNKGSGGFSGDRQSGSHAFRDVARSLIFFATDKESGNRVFTVNKSSYSDATGKSYGFRLVSQDITTDDGRTTAVARVEHLGPSSVSTEDIWAREYDRGNSGRTDSTSWLRSEIERLGGSGRATEIQDAGELEGISSRTLQDAAKRLGVRKSRDGKGGPVWWHLDSVPAVPAVPADRISNTAPTAPTAGKEDEGPL
jgi:RecA-family ATPase